MLLGSFCERIFFEPPALERLKAAKGAVVLEVEGHFVAVEDVVPGCGLEGQDGSHDRIGGIGKMTGYGSIQRNGLGLDDLLLSPAGDGHGVDQLRFDHGAGLEAGH